MMILGGIHMDLKTMRCKARITIAKMGLYMKVPRAMIPLWESGKIQMTQGEYDRYLRIINDKNRIA